MAIEAILKIFKQPNQMNSTNYKRRNFLKRSFICGAAMLTSMLSSCKQQPISPASPPASPPVTNGSQDILTVSMPSRFVSVIVYGATGNGITDDSEAIQNALIDNAEVWFPAGTYLVSNLKLKGGQTILGEGAASIIRQNAGAQYCVSANSGSEGFTDPSMNLTGIQIQNIRFEGQAGNVPFDEHIHLLNLNGVSDVQITGCQLIGYVGDGIYLGSGNVTGLERHNQRVLIQQCQFDGLVKNNRNGISIIDGTDITIDQCTFTRSGRQDMPGGIDLEPDSNSDAFSRIQGIHITNCVFQDMGAGALIALNLRPNDKLAYPANTITISNCKGYGIGQTGQTALAISQNSWADTDVSPTVNTQPLNLLITNCYFEGIYRPLVMASTKGARIENTTFYSSPAFGYLGDGNGQSRNRDITLKGCLFKQIGLSNSVGVVGLRVYGNDYLTLDTCNFEDCGPSDGSGGLGLNFAGTCSSSYINLINTTVSSPLKQTSYAIRVYLSHILSPATNQQIGTLLLYVSGNDFQPS